MVSVGTTPSLRATGKELQRRRTTLNLRPARTRLQSCPQSAAAYGKENQDRHKKENGAQHCAGASLWRQQPAFVDVDGLSVHAGRGPLPGHLIADDRGPG